MTSQSPTTTCLSDAHLAELIDRGLDPVDLRRVEAHVAECPECALALAATAGALEGTGHERVAFALSPTDPGQYAVHRELARGGMGRIVEAWDRRNRRPVAIKMLLETSELALARFTREARITARLQHPSIVTLYEAGLWSAGEPFFAMKYVAGRPMGSAFVEAKTLRSKLDLLPNLLAMTEALAYAHRKGIVHRDLKPHNVLVGEFGETVVIDWGLARELDGTSEEERREGAGSGDATISATLTVLGTALGTPCYMAPEQARGESVDARADVYAIGAILYDLFAGAPPFLAATSRETLSLVLAGPPPPLAGRAPEIPADLAAVIEKAMARDPASRYANASELAIELKRFLSGNLVTARAYSVGALVRRWVAHHRALLSMAATLVVVLSVMGIVSVRRVVRERDRADAMKVSADHARATAVTQRDAAENVVQFVIGDLRQRLEPLGRIDLLAGVGEEVLSYYVAVAPDLHALDEAALLRRGAALDTLALVEARKKNHHASASLSKSAAAAYEVAVQRDPTSSDARSGLALAELDLGRAEWFSGDRDQMLPAYERGGTEARTLAAAAPDDPRWKILRGSADMLVAIARADAGELEVSRAAYASASEVLGGVDAKGLDDEWHVRLARALTNANIVQVRLGDPEAGVRAMKRSIAIWQELLGSHPYHATWTHSLAATLASLGDADEELGNYDAAHDALVAAIDASRPIVERDPANAESRRDMAVAEAQLCGLEDARGRVATVAAACREALSIAETIAAEHPGEAALWDDEARQLRGVARLEMATGNGEAAIRRGRAAVAIADELAKAHPQNRLYRHSLAASDDVVAHAELAAGHVEAAIASARAAVEVSRAQLADAPTDTLVEDSLAEFEVTLGDGEAQQGDRAAAQADYRDAFGRLDRLVAADARDASLGSGLVGAGLALLSSGGPVDPHVRERTLAVADGLERSGRLSPVLAARVHAARRAASP